MAIRILSSENINGSATIETGINLESGTLVIKNATTDSSGLKIFQDSSDASKIHNNYDGTLQLGTNNVTRLTIDSTSATFEGIITAKSSSSGDYVRLYGSSGTGKWDIYGNGANLRISDNESAGVLAVDTGATFGGTVTAPRIGIPSANASFALYNNSNSYFNGAVTVDSTFTQTGAAASTFSGTLRSGNFAIGVAPSSFGSGVPTITLQGTAANGRGGAIVFKELDGTVTTNIYSTDGADGYGTVINAAQGSFRVSIGALAANKLEINSSGATFSQSITLSGNITSTATSFVLGFNVTDNNSFMNINHSGNEAWEFRCQSIGGTNDFVTIGASGGGMVGFGDLGDLLLDSKSTSFATTELNKIIFRKLHPAGASSGYYDQASIRAKTFGGYSGGLNFYTNKSLGAGSYGERLAMSINNFQNVGIGTDSPPVKLSINGWSYNPGAAANAGMVGLKQSNASSYGYVVEASANDKWMMMGHNGTNGVIETTYAASDGHSNLEIKTGSSNNIILQSTGGKVGIGSSSSPNTKLDVSGTTGTRNRNTQGSSVYETSLYFIAAGNATTNVSIDTRTSFPPIAGGGFILVEVSASGYGNSGSNGLVFSYISGGYGGHYGGQGQPYHPVEIIANTMQAGSCTFYYPNWYTVGIAVTTTNSAGLGGVMRVKVTTTY